MHTHMTTHMCTLTHNWEYINTSLYIFIMAICKQDMKLESLKL